MKIIKIIIVSVIIGVISTSSIQSRDSDGSIEIQNVSKLLNTTNGEPLPLTEPITVKYQLVNVYGDKC